MPLAWQKLLAVCALSGFLGACASGPVGGPVVQDLSLGKAPDTTSEDAAKAVQTEPQASAILVQPEMHGPLSSSAEEVPKEKIKEPLAEPLSQPQASPQVQTKTPVATPVAPLPEAHQQVVESLLYEADQAKARGDTAVAIMKLQQAQRIAPREPKVYARLAALYLADGQAAKAEQLSRKGLTLVADNAAYSHYFWRVIAACRRFQGDTDGEAAALSKARQFQ